MSLEVYKTPVGEFDLRRYPARKTEVLRAWNAADTLLVEQVLTLGLPAQSLLVVNDEYGGLSVPLQPQAVWTDSRLSAIAIEENALRNGQAAIPAIPSTRLPAGDFSAVAMKVPKQLPYLEYQLAGLAALLKPGTPVIAGGMDKHLSPKVAALLERIIGPTQRHRGRQKARVFTSIRDERPAPPLPDGRRYYSEELGCDLLSMANVFSRERVDIGSRFLLESLGQLDPVEHLIDLACGNGVIGLTAKTRGLCQSLALCDESAMAVESARRNALTLLPRAGAQLSFYQGDGLLGYTGTRADMILCNPPFHANHTVEEYVGRRLLAQSAQHLKEASTLCLVANRHLDYLPTLRRGFGRVEKLNQNSKFTIWLAQK